MYIDKPEEITFEQQKILAEINKYFSENIKNVLPNYNRNIPNRDDYRIITNGLLEVAVMQNFATARQQTPTQLAEQADSIARESTQPKPVTNEQDISAKNSQSKPKENNVTSQNKKMYILVTSALAIAGIVSGIAIAIYSGMLAVGIAVGVCCLVVAGIAYRLNRPVSSFEGNNIQELSNNALVPYKLTKDVAGGITYSVSKPSDKLDKPDLEANQQVNEVC